MKYLWNILSALLGLTFIALAVFLKRSRITRWVVFPALMVLLTVGGFFVYRAFQPEPFAFAGTFVPIETFDTYSDGDLTGNNGGSGWAAAWSGNTIFDVSSSNPGQGTKSASITSVNPGGGEPEIQRQMTTGITDTSTIMHFMVRWSGTDNMNGYCLTVDTDSTGGGTIMYICVDTSRKLVAAASGGSEVTILASVTEDTWYHVYMDMDWTNGDVRGYASTVIPYATPTWSSYSNGTFSGATGSYIRFSIGGANDGTVTFQWDDIRDVGSDFTPLGGSSDTSLMLLVW